MFFFSPKSIFDFEERQGCVGGVGSFETGGKLSFFDSAPFPSSSFLLLLDGMKAFGFVHLYRLFDFLASILARKSIDLTGAEIDGPLAKPTVNKIALTLNK
jgi:hypothetical protein